jgi:thiamine biosynthesis lipoprotein
VAKVFIEAAFKKMEEIESIASLHKRDSALSILNKKGELKVCPSHLLIMLKECIKYSKRSKGAFDVTIAPLSRLWKNCIKSGRFPKEKEIRLAHSLVGYHFIKIEDESVYLKEGVKVDLSAVAKGYAVHQAASTLRRMGASSFLIEAGGDIEVGGGPWRVGVKHPREKGFICILKLKDKGVATSGDYQQYFFWRGHRFHHVIDPRTGYPSNGFCSATVVAPNAFLADILSTTLMVLGPKDYRKFLEGVDVGAVCMTEDGRMFVHRMEDFVQKWLCKQEEIFHANRRG